MFLRGPVCHGNSPAASLNRCLRPNSTDVSADHRSGPHHARLSTAKSTTSTVRGKRGLWHTPSLPALTASPRSASCRTRRQIGHTRRRSIRSPRRTFRSGGETKPGWQEASSFCSGNRGVADPASCVLLADTVRHLPPLTENVRSEPIPSLSGNFSALCCFSTVSGCPDADTNLLVLLCQGGPPASPNNSHPGQGTPGCAQSRQRLERRSSVGNRLVIAASACQAIGSTGVVFLPLH